METVSNPFNITKAVDFTDEQILKMWVDWPSSEKTGLLDLVKPTSPMPMFIVGGKGSGKTHLMRYFSYPLQMLRAKQKNLNSIFHENYVGVYIRCGGLNPSRFTGKGIEEEVWEAVFEYYTELWIASYILECLDEILSEQCEEIELVKICDAISSLFDQKPQKSFKSFKDLRMWIVQLQKDLDYLVNNCVFTRKLSVEILATRGKLIFGIPDVICSNFKDVSECIFVYLIDEYENFNHKQQIYLNTIIRERRGHCSFKIGAKLFGIRTHKTLSADEENKENSEFEKVDLDSYYRRSPSYVSFAKNIIALRIANSCLFTNCLTVENALPNIESWFEQKSERSIVDDIANSIAQKSESSHRRKMLQQLSKAYGLELAKHVIGNLSFPSHPVLEKAAFYKIYQKWAEPDALYAYAIQLREEIDELIQSGTLSKEIDECIKHYKTDFIAQLQKDLGKKVQYSGLDTIIEISWGNPRHLLMMLKNIFSWASFAGEVGKDSIYFSTNSQDLGIKESSDWFYNDSKLLGENGDHIQRCTQRLCEFFRNIRFSSKPSECSVCAFSVDMTSISERSREVIDLATKCSILVDVGTHTDRNNSAKQYKYQINRLISPRWDLPFSRRGTIELTCDEINAIFDENFSGQYKNIVAKRLERMEPPFRNKTANAFKAKHRAFLLPGISEE